MYNWFVYFLMMVVIRFYDCYILFKSGIKTHSFVPAHVPFDFLLS